jgi:hypothetical protein
MIAENVKDDLWNLWSSKKLKPRRKKKIFI